MTLEQLRIFIAVAERQHLTQAATALHLTPSAVSAALRTLEDRYGVPLFDRVGRGIQTTDAGRAFLHEAKATLASAAATELMLTELGGLQRGSLRLQASQTIAGYWLPPLLVRFNAAYPSIEIDLTIGNTQSVARAVLEGIADLGFVEGLVHEPALQIESIDEDRLVMVVVPSHPWAGGQQLRPRDLLGARWVMREPGSGTRAAFEANLEARGIDPTALNAVLTLPSNEAVCAAVEFGRMVAVVSSLVANPHIAAGRLALANYELAPRAFYLLHHTQRYRTKAALALEKTMRPSSGAGESA